MRGNNLENLDKNELLNYIHRLEKKCEVLTQEHKKNLQLIAQQHDKINDYQKKMTDIGSTLKLLY